MSRGSEPTHYPQKQDSENGQFQPTIDKPEPTTHTPVNRERNEDGQGSRQVQQDVEEADA